MELHQLMDPKRQMPRIRQSQLQRIFSEPLKKRLYPKGSETKIFKQELQLHAIMSEDTKTKAKNGKNHFADLKR